MTSQKKFGTNGLILKKEAKKIMLFHKLQEL
jgi:hypothetical protein